MVRHLGCRRRTKAQAGRRQAAKLQKAATRDAAPSDNVVKPLQPLRHDPCPIDPPCPLFDNSGTVI
jgi:hypothetical protein